MTKLAPEWVRNIDPVIRIPARYRWTTAPAPPALKYKIQHMHRLLSEYDIHVLMMIILNK